MKPIFKSLITVTIFSIAMGYLETAVVVYLRELYFPRGFTFPIIPMREIILITELGRELATLIMLIIIGNIAGKNFAQRFVFFLYSFAIWDIFYYVFLKVLLDWPSSLFGWDVLFLIPVPWIGPVLAPCLISLTMIGLTFTVIYLNIKNIHVVFRWTDWFWMIVGSLVLIYSFTMDYFNLLFSANISSESIKMLTNIKNFIPKNYNWWIFGLGEIIILFGIISMYIRSKKKNIPEDVYEKPINKKLLINNLASKQVNYKLGLLLIMMMFGK